VRSLFSVLEQQQVARANRAARLADAPDGYVYAIRRTDREVYTKTGEVVDGQLVQFPITKRTDGRVYFLAYRLRDDFRGYGHVDSARLTFSASGRSVTRMTGEGGKGGCGSTREPVRCRRRRGMAGGR
jgi:hypothetical protein